MTKNSIAMDGFNKTQTLNEGYVRKGGINPSNSGIKERPAAPAPIAQPGQSSGTTSGSTTGAQKSE